MIKTIKKALKNNKRVYAKYITGIYKGQIVGIKSMQMLENNLKNGKLELHNITTDAKTLKNMIRRA